MLGTLPPLPTRIQRQPFPEAVANRTAWSRDPWIEAVDSIRMLLQHQAKAGLVRSALITSAVAGEGKSTLASQLAASLARAGCKTLLIDGDLREPSLHRLFHLSQKPGFCELLRGEAEMSALLTPTCVPGLTLLTAGEWDEAALHALSQEKTRILFDEFRQDFDFVLVDSAPVLPIADTLLVGQYLDAVVFSVLRSVSRVPKVIAARERISLLGIPILGAVVNDIGGEDYSSVSKEPVLSVG